MVYTIKEGCRGCDRCWPQCPSGAIKPSTEREGYWIDPTLCNSCPDVAVPRCVSVCESDAYLQPLQAKRGRCKSTLLPPAIPEIFINGQTAPFASSMVIWETCTVLSQRQLLPWQSDATGKLCYRRPVNHGRGEMRFRLAMNPERSPDKTSKGDSLLPMSTEEARGAIAQFDIRATCAHLIFAAYVVTLDCPWKDAFTLNDQHIEKYLGLDRRKDLSKLDKLTLIKNWVYQSCRILVSLDWPRQGKVQAFTLNEQPIWNLLDTQYYFEEDTQGAQHLIGLSFTIRAGGWAKHFLNKRDYRRQTAFFQYGSLPQVLLTEVMSSWQQHEGAVRILLWLLFKLRLGGDHRLTIRTLLRIAYGEERLKEAITVRGAHKRLLKTFEGDLEAICHHGLKPCFDLATYPADIQPLWVKAHAIPDNVDDELAFWTDDASRLLTNHAPRDKWPRLLNARLSGFELSEVWQQTMRRSEPKPRRNSSKSNAQFSQVKFSQARQPHSVEAHSWHDPTTQANPSLTGSKLKVARQQNKLSQRALADCLGKSQSWIRDVEKGRFSISAKDEMRLRQALNIT